MRVKRQDIDACDAMNGPAVARDCVSKHVLWLFCIHLLLAWCYVNRSS